MSKPLYKFIIMTYIEIRDDGYFYVCLNGIDVKKTSNRSEAERIKCKLNQALSLLEEISK